MTEQVLATRGHDLSGMPAIVVGAAVGGASAALLLARAGARVTLLERIAAPKAAGAGILLQPNGLAVLYGLGLEQALRARGTMLPAARILDAKGRVRMRTPTPDYGDGLDHVMVLRRSDLFAVLLGAVAAEPSIDAHFGAEVFDATPGGEITYSHDERTETISADLIVAADGVHSVVRRRAGVEASIAEGKWYVRGLVDSAVDGVDEFGEYWTARGIFGVAPVIGSVYFYGSAGTPALRNAVATKDIASFRAEWQRALPLAGDVLSRIAHFDDLLLNQVTRIDCASFVAGRIALLGDAAHAMAPNLGQGANSALVDAAVLVHELAARGGIDAALAAYDARRRPAVRRVQDLADRAARAAEVRNPVARWLRDRAVRAGSRIAGSERSSRLAQQEDPASLLRTVRELQRTDRVQLDAVL